MLTVETLITCLSIAAGVGAIFYMGVKTGRELQYKEVQKVSKFLGVLMERKIFESESAANAAYVVSQWFAGKLEDLHNRGPYYIWDEERDTKIEEKNYEKSTEAVLADDAPVGDPRSGLSFDD